MPAVNLFSGAPGRRTFALFLLVLLLCLLLAACGGVEETPAALPEGVTSAQIVKVVDGDTMDVQVDGEVERLRLIGLDTPETRDPRRPVQCFGIEASERAKDLLDGQQVYLESDPTQGERDRFGRLLRYLWLDDGQMYNLQMIAQGYAHEYTYNVPYKYQEQFQDAEREARAQERGFWAADTCAGDTTRAADAVILPVPTQVRRTTPTRLPRATATLRYSGPYDPEGPDRDCGDFESQAEAQAFYLAAGGPSRDPHRLDADNNRRACESLP